MTNPLLITGASDGIGLALARSLCSQGRALVLTGRRPFAEILDPPFSSSSYYIEADLNRSDAPAFIDRALSERGVSGLSAIVHNAAIGWTGAPGVQSSASVQEMLTVNLNVPIALTHQLRHRLESNRLTERQRPRVAFISSIAAAFPCPDYAVYAATKAALEGFARALRIEWSNQVDVQVIVLGPVRTDIHSKAGMDLQAIGWDRFPSPESAAAGVSRALKSRRSVATIGWTNRWLRELGQRSDRWIDRAILRDRRRRSTIPPAARFPGRCVITGAADGIGRALALRFVQAGARVIGIDRDRQRAAATLENLREVAAEHGAPLPSFLFADLASSADREHLLDELANAEDSEGPVIDVFIHNAGVNHSGRFETIPMSTHQRVLDVNLAAPLTLTAALLDRRLIAPGGALAFLSSLSHYVGYPGSAVYAATKDGVASYARSLALALASENIHVLTIFPGPVRTEQARLNSPDNRREHRRMDPAVVADRIFRAIRARRSILIPGLGHQAAAKLASWAPGLADRAMKSLFLRS